MVEVSQILLNRLKSRYTNLEDQTEAIKSFEAAWRSSYLVINLIQEELSEELNKLIKESEDIENMEPLKVAHYNGQRVAIRKIRKLLFRNNETILGE